MLIITELMDENLTVHDTSLPTEKKTKKKTPQRESNKCNRTSENRFKDKGLPLVFFVRVKRLLLSGLSDEISS